jgi:hypothetical protein
MFKPAIWCHKAVENLFSRMPERCMSEIMGQGQGFNQVFIEPQTPGYATTNLCNFERMGQAGAVVISFMIDKDLGFVFEAPEGGTMDNPVAITFIGGAIIFVNFAMPATT